MLRKRLDQGMSPEDALSTKSSKSRKPDRSPLEAWGESRSAADWLRDPRCSVSQSTLWMRIESGWSVEDALSTPPAPVSESKTYKAFGEVKSLWGWVKDDRCVTDHAATLDARIRKQKMSVEDALTLPLNPNTSCQENEIAQFVESLGFTVVRNTRQVIPPMEIDIFLPSENFGIEFNGLYWHTENQKGIRYHFDKAEAAEAKGVRLLQVWEDDWRDRRSQVESLIAHKLHRSHLDKVFARNCRAVLDSDRTAVFEFLDDHHIQGGANFSTAISLLRGSERLAVCTFLKGSDNTWTLVRYATNAIVVGGFSKCLALFKRTQRWDKIITYADRCVSDGLLYDKTGFRRDVVLRPEYWYLHNGSRMHKFKFRKSRVKSNPEFVYENGMTELELAKLNGLERIFDAGKIRYIIER